MTRQAIKNKFEKINYKVVKDFSGVWVITPPAGFSRSFASLNAAAKYYF
jgi:phosphate/sulfate permease